MSFEVHVFYTIIRQVLRVLINLNLSKALAVMDYRDPNKHGVVQLLLIRHQSSAAYSSSLQQQLDRPIGTE